MPSKPTKKAAAKPAKTAMARASSVVPFAQLDPTASKSFESMEKIMSSTKNQYEKITADASASSRQGMEAFIKSGNIMMKGAEQMMKTLAEIAQEFDPAQHRSVQNADGLQDPQRIDRNPEPHCTGKLRRSDDHLHQAV